jgi:hypothetical protein
MSHFFNNLNNIQLGFTELNEAREFPRIKYDIPVEFGDKRTSRSNKCLITKVSKNW